MAQLKEIFTATLLFTHSKTKPTNFNISYVGYQFFFSPPVLMHGGLLGVAFCPSVCPSVHPGKY